MRALKQGMATLVIAACMLTACAIPDEPSVARQAASTLTSPLTITADLGGASSASTAEITLSVTGIDNGDWHAEQRPDSRLNGFHDVTLTSTQPSLTRSFAKDADQNSVSFDLIGSLGEPAREVLRARLSYRDALGWYLELPDQPAMPFGEVSSGATSTEIDIAIATADQPAELTISVTPLP